MLATLVVAGLVAGAIYALVGLGLVIIYRTSQVVNFAQGDVSTLLTFVGFTLMTQWGLPYLAAFALTLLAAFVFGAILERTVMRPVASRSPIVAVGVTLGIALILNGTSSWLWGTQVQSFPAPTAAAGISVGGMTVSGANLAILGVLVLSIALLVILFRHTRIGISMRATSEDAAAAELMGIDVRAMAGLSWGMAAVLGATAGMLVSPAITLTPNQLDLVVIRSFAAVVVGGFTSTLGAVVGGLFIGVVESVVAGYAPADLTNVAMFAIVLVVLVFRPQGLLAGEETRKGLL
ncbi:branched-chain amino acid ABC transporter permease [bacterium]|nr:MAG: branched-chain amino acid ABC transporter permease [bacterium]